MTTTSPAAPAAPSVREHEHGWTVESRHRTSDGDVLYVRCDCGGRRIDRQTRADAPPSALSRTIGGVPAAR